MYFIDTKPLKARLKMKRSKILKVFDKISKVSELLSAWKYLLRQILIIAAFIAIGKKPPGKLKKHGNLTSENIIKK